MIGRGRRVLALIAALGTIALTPVAAQTPAPAPLKIGLIMSFSGPGALLGRAVNGAIGAWFAMHGGERLGGRPVLILRRDDAHQAETARRLAQELVVQDNVDILMGGTSAPEVFAIGAVATQAKIPYFIVNATQPGILTTLPYALRTTFLTTDFAPPLARWSLRNGIKTVYAVVLDYSTGADTLTALSAAFAAAGGKVVGSVAIPLNTTDYSAYLLRVKDAKPDALFAFVGGGPASINLVKQFASTGLKATIKLTGTADLISEELLPAEGDDAVGTVTVSNYSSDHDSKLNRDFVRAYRAALPDVTPADAPSFIPVQVFDLLTAIDYAVTAQKGTVDPSKTVAVLLGKTFESPRGTISFDPQTHEIRENMYIRQVERHDGRLVNAEIASFLPVK